MPSAVKRANRFAAAVGWLAIAAIAAEIARVGLAARRNRRELRDDQVSLH